MNHPVPPANLPLVLVESRYWVLNARLCDPAPSIEWLQKVFKSFSGQLISGDDLKPDVVRHPLDNYSDVTNLLQKARRG